MNSFAYIVLLGYHSRGGSKDSNAPPPPPPPKFSGTKQYWFVRQSELKCMIREWGSRTCTLFLCAECESPDTEISGVLAIFRPE